MSKEMVEPSPDEDAEVAAEMRRLADEAEAESVPTDEPGRRIAMVREAIRFADCFTPGVIEADDDVFSLDKLWNPAARQARDLALVDAFRFLGAEFAAMRPTPPPMPPFVLDVSRIGRG